MHVTIIGAGIAGLTAALELAKQGIRVEVVERGTRLGMFACSSLAGGMISPWCEMEKGEAAIAQLGGASIRWWQENYSGTVKNGTLVVASSRDASELTRFAAHTQNYRWLAPREITALEPDLGDRFTKALYYPDEAHVEPKLAMQALADELKTRGVQIRFGVNAKLGDLKTDLNSDWIIDCRGLAARDVLTDLRGVRGEMIIVKTKDVTLSRPVNLLHPRFPLYVVPRDDHHFMLGATVIESESRARISARSALELLSAAYTLHPAFAEAEIVEMGADLRPAFADNLPQLLQQGKKLFINGLYRHGFLAAPVLAQAAADIILKETGEGDANLRERNLA
jgi:glycine oxidase